MLKLSRRVEYGLLAMKYLTHHAAKRAVSVREIAGYYDIPEPLLAKVMQQLKRHEVVASIKGSSGGYRPTAHMLSVTLANLMRSLDDEISLADCIGVEGDCGCRQSMHCDIREPITRLNAKVWQLFDDVTVADLLSSEAIAPLSLRMAQPRP